jgi:hypothetical protein
MGCRRSFARVRACNLQVQYLEVRLKPETAPLAKGFDAVCICKSPAIRLPAGRVAAATSSPASLIDCQLLPDALWGPGSLPAVVNDRVNEQVCKDLEDGGVKCIALRCAGGSPASRRYRQHTWQPAVEHRRLFL